MSVQIGKKVPSFNLPATGEQKISLAQLGGKKFVLYFYPKDNTPGCTIESEGFRDQHKKFKKLGVEILGISKDSVESHEKFKKKFKFPFELLSDENEVVCQKFSVIKEKNMYGKKFMGIERSTFLVDEEGKLLKEWRKVKVDGHVDEVYNFAKEL
jgi:thioredoxin-dependent peroxiredoxin